MKTPHPSIRPLENIPLKSKTGEIFVLKEAGLKVYKSPFQISIAVLSNNIYLQSMKRCKNEIQLQTWFKSVPCTYDLLQNKRALLRETGQHKSPPHI